MGIEGSSPSTLTWDAEANLGREVAEDGFEAVGRHIVTMPRAAARFGWRGGRECLLLALVAGEPTVGLNMLVIYAHALPRNVGGARNGWVRRRISMKIIGAPRCLQRKVRAWVSADASSLVSMAAGACSNTRMVASHRATRAAGIDA